MYSFSIILTGLAVAASLLHAGEFLLCRGAVAVGHQILDEPQEDIAHRALAGLDAVVTGKDGTVDDAADAGNVGQVAVVRANGDVASAGAEDLDQRALMFRLVDQCVGSQVLPQVGRLHAGYRSHTIGLGAGIDHIEVRVMSLPGSFTDGLDGLAIVPVTFAAAAYAMIAYLTGNFVFASYLGIQFAPGAGELAVLLGALIGSGMGFLWYNAYPAKVFMGDTGSLGLGGMLGVVAVATKHEFALVVIGGLFVIEAVSVLTQIGWFKITKRLTGEGKRIFLMAPLHHHFQKQNWPETRVVVRFWILSVLFALAGLATLKLR